jgi:hypothetical protein
VAFSAFADMVKAEAGVLDSDPAEVATEKLVQSLAALPVEERERGWIEQNVRPLIGVAGEAQGGDRRAESFAAWRRYLEARAELRPHVLVFEDLHWADDDLLDFVDRQLLAAEEQADLLARIGGNPLFAEQFVRMSAELGLDELPESLHGIIAARLDSLTQGEKTLLQDAAVFGRVFWGGALADLSGVPREEADAQLQQLVRKEFSGASGAASWQVRSSMRSRTRSSATSRTGRSRGPSGLRGTSSRRRGSRRSAGTGSRIAPTRSRTTT